MLDFITNLISSHGPLFAYCLLFVCAFVENIFPPIPGDAVTLFGAYLVGREVLDFVPVFLATTTGSFASFMSMYYLGRRKGRDFIVRKNSSVYSAERLARVDRWFARYGLKLVLANRFLSGVRALVALGAGIGNMPAGRVALCSLASIIVWNGIIIYAGQALGMSWEGVKSILGTYSQIIAVIIVVVAVILLIRILRRKRRAS